jgi:thiol-disulfide isomerase/thioredoxin
MNKPVLTIITMMWLCGSFAQPPIKHPLTIGDTLPGITIENVYNYPVSKIQLSQLNNKLVILDFWSRYCASCIAAFPKLDSIQKEFNQQVQVITISDFTNKEELFKTPGKYKPTKNTRLPVSLFNEELAAYFPHEMVSHIVWINKGRIAAITGGDYVTREHIQELLSTTTVDWPVKKDVPDFDYRQPMLTLKQSGIPSPAFLYYSALTAHLDGIAPPNGIFTDSIHNIISAGYYNRSLLSLCKIALGNPPAGTILFDTTDISMYQWNRKGYYSEWARSHTYCYSIQLPLDSAPADIQKIIEADLLRWLGILGIHITTGKKTTGGKETITYTITTGNGIHP